MLLCFLMHSNIKLKSRFNAFLMTVISLLNIFSYLYQKQTINNMSEEVRKKSKATYNTKKQTIAFGAWLVSDERRLFYQKRNREYISRGLIDPIPWATSVRSVTEEDYKMWKEGEQAQPKKFTAEDMQEMYEKGVNDELKRWTNGSND